MNIRSDGTTDTSGGKQAARDSNLQVIPSSAKAGTRWTCRRWHQCGGCGQNRCFSRGCRSATGMDDTAALLAKHIDNICGSGGNNIRNMPGNIDCADISASPSRPCSTGLGFTRSLAWPVAPWSRPESPIYRFC
jgi:hypothetical protein